VRRAAGRCHHENQAIDELWVGERQLERDEPAHRDTDQRRTRDTELARQCVHILGEVGDRVLLGGGVTVADVAVVDGNRAVALAQYPQLLIPALTLCADPAQQ
jgi:hypothetical protein